MTLILASRSAARRRMLEGAGVQVTSVQSAVDEEAEKARLRAAGVSPAELALGLARAKALAAGDASGLLVLGADQTLELADGAMLDKPGSGKELRRQLERMSGVTHRLHAAAAVAIDGRIDWEHLESVRMTMRHLGADFIERYVREEYENVRGSVGGYHVEGVGAQLFERIEGSHFAVLGLPLLPLLGYLRLARELPR